LLGNKSKDCIKIFVYYFWRYIRLIDWDIYINNLKVVT